VSEHLLEVSDLAVDFSTREGTVRAVRGLSFDLNPRETIGIVGESGSGKSTVALAILGLLPRNASVTGSVRSGETELTKLSEKALAKVRGSSIAYIPQDPLTSLNPAYSIGWQVAEAIWAKGLDSKQGAHRRAVELLDTVGIPRAAEQMGRFPHEFSGGMRQRVAIAMAMANNPRVIIADEPTTALDVTIQAQVLDALRAARDETHASLILITHDLGIVAGLADRVMVMYAGRAVETAPTDEVFYRARMPYTLGLLGSLPRLYGERAGALRPIPGIPPSLLMLQTGCPFRPRCPVAVDRCVAEEPGLDPVGPDHRAACHRSMELEAGTTTLFDATWEDTGDASWEDTGDAAEIAGQGHTEVPRG
jgi:oligopeptide/dipeptide ABC transporter ATP-binding protein